MDQATKLLLDGAQRLFADGCDYDLQEAAESGAFPSDLWQDIEDNGLPLVLVPEDRGGIGLDAVSACAVLRVAGAFALPLPLADTMIAAAVLAKAGIDIPEGPLCVVPAGSGAFDADGNRWSGRCSDAPWVRDGHAVLISVLDGEGHQQVAVIPTKNLEDHLQHRKSPGGDPRVDLRLQGLELASISVEGGTDLTTWVTELGALTRVSMTAGALDRLLDLCIEHATGRIQFGRPVAKFQAVQNLIAVLAGETAAVGVSAPAAVAAWEQHGDTLAVAAAKTRANEASAKAARIAHQVHAAIGYTREHILHRFTRRLWSWRDEYGSELNWAKAVGEQTLTASGDGIWPRLTAHG